MQNWLDNVKSENRIGTWRLYSSTFRNHIEPRIGKILFKALTSANVRALLQGLEKDGVGARTRQNVHKVLRACYESAVREGILARNVVSLVKHPKAESKEQTVLTQEEAKRLLETASKTPWHALIRLALHSGMREGEIFALTIDDLRLDDSFPHLLVNATLTEDESGVLVRTLPKTAASLRRVDLDAETVRLLREQAQDKVKGDFLFTTPDGSALRKSNFLRRVFHPMVAEAGLPKITFHSLRHVMNTLLLARGVASHLDLAKRLGHATPRMTLERYARVVPGAQAEIAQAAGEFLK